MALTLNGDSVITAPLTVGFGGGNITTNTAAGYQALNTNTTGSALTAVGYQSLYANTTGIDLTATGYQSLKNNTTGAANAAFGQFSLFGNTTGSYNTAVGRSALESNTTASWNTAVGMQALYTNTTGSESVAVGYEALKVNTTGSYNVALGQGSLRANTTASENTAVGNNSLRSNTTGANNTALGASSAYGITTGTYNINLGSQDTVLTTGSYNTQIGRYANASSSSVSYALLINTDNTARTDKGSSTGFIFTGGSMYQGNNSASWATTSDARLKKNIVNNTTGLSAITQIQVRNFEYRLPEEITEVPQDQAIQKQGIQLGAIAQELKEILPDCVKTESTGVMSVDTTNLTWYLINAIKELNAKVTALEAQLGAK